MIGKFEIFKVQWVKITSDHWILELYMWFPGVINGKTDQTFVPSISGFQRGGILQEILDFTWKGIIEPLAKADPDEFISNNFKRF